MCTVVTFFGVITVNNFSLVNKNYALIGFGSLRVLSTNISQGNVGTSLRCGGIFNYCFSRNVLLSMSVTEFLKSVSIRQS